MRRTLLALFAFVSFTALTVATVFVARGQSPFASDRNGAALIFQIKLEGSDAYDTYVSGIPNFRWDQEGQTPFAWRVLQFRRDEVWVQTAEGTGIVELSGQAMTLNEAPIVSGLQVEQ